LVNFLILINADLETLWLLVCRAAAAADDADDDNVRDKFIGRTRKGRRELGGGGGGLSK
jgi:hypothetical protein